MPAHELSLTAAHCDLSASNLLLQLVPNGHVDDGSEDSDVSYSLHLHVIDFEVMHACTSRTSRPSTDIDVISVILQDFRFLLGLEVSDEELD